MGMIMAFQAMMPMRQFGVDIFVVNLVALSISARTRVACDRHCAGGSFGSAFAAEIGR